MPHQVSPSLKAGSETLSYLYGLQRRGMKFGLRNMRSLLNRVGHPERAFPSVHIAGTNGKGSTAAFLSSMFMEAGCRTGLYTSPHLIRFTERIRINGREIPGERLGRYVRMLRPAIEEVRATFFEATTCVAFLYFADEEVDIAVIETGLGGRLDATNVLLPLAGVITNIDLDHREYLGNTIASIAREKGGIIKRRVPMVTAARDRTALRTLRAIAKRKGARFIEARKRVRMERASSGASWMFQTRCLGRFASRLGLAGAFQQENAALAVAVADTLRENTAFVKDFRSFGKQAVRRGLSEVARNSGLEGRLERLGKRGEYIIDVAHNPAGIRALVSALRRERGVPRAAVFGVMKDKDHLSMLRSLVPFVRKLIPVAPRMERALAVSRLRMEAKRCGFEVGPGGSIRQGLREARRLMQRARPEEGDYILVVGSHYVVGEFLAHLRSAG